MKYKTSYGRIEFSILHSSVLYIHKIYVNEEYRGQGYSYQLLDDIFKEYDLSRIHTFKGICLNTIAFDLFGKYCQIHNFENKCRMLRE